MATDDDQPGRGPVELRPLDFAEREDDLRAVQDETAPKPRPVVERRHAWQMTYPGRPGFAAWGAFTPTGDLVGFVFATTGRKGSWWDQHVRPMAEQTGNAEILEDSLEVVELHVRPAFQGHGIGRALLRRIMADRPEQWCVLTVVADNARAWGLYTSLGFTEMTKSFTFPGDERPYVVMGRPLPLTP